MKKIGTVKPYPFESFLILSLSIEWIEKFGKIPEFVVSIDKNNNLILTGPKIIKVRKSGDDESE